MKEHGILFNSEMMLANLDGTKTRTCRILKPQPNNIIAKFIGLGREGKISYYKPYSIGDLIWARETYYCDTKLDKERCIYKADEESNDLANPECWIPSIHMPKWASRYWAEITEIKVIQIQDTTEEEARNEGIIPEFEMGIADFVVHKTKPVVSYKISFKHLWNKLYPGSWDRNDWVIAIEYEKVER